jgi:hypothetical protein
MEKKWTTAELKKVRDQILCWLGKGDSSIGRWTFGGWVAEDNVVIKEHFVVVKFHTHLWTYTITAEPDLMSAGLTAVDPLHDRDFCGGMDMAEVEFNEEGWNKLLAEFTITVAIKPDGKSLLEVLNERRKKREGMRHNPPPLEVIEVPDQDDRLRIQQGFAEKVAHMPENKVQEALQVGERVQKLSEEKQVQLLKDIDEFTLKRLEELET